MILNRLVIFKFGVLLTAVIGFSCQGSQNQAEEAKAENKKNEVVNGLVPKYQEIDVPGVVESKALQENKKKLEAANAKIKEFEAKEAAEIQRKREIWDEKNHPERYIELNTESHRTERLFTSKVELNGQLRSKAKHGYYESVVIEVAYYSKNDVLLGSEDITVNDLIESDYRAFSKRIKPVRKAYYYKCSILLATYNEYEDYNVRY